MNDKEILELIQKHSIKSDGKEKLSCSAAWDISAKNDVSLMKIGELCNANSIKICDCSLGCF
ncbi:MAG TPA: hypothetical protein DD381_12140 [Lentisphaeria bacterium]|nr:MAG: hypothetical protein A2X47_09590 [Lentisphaerae bacterium GWF2_38_69]HBM17076.1 hypothetical protein [Lentisphaeria bacterium]